MVLAAALVGAAAWGAAAAGAQPQHQADFEQGQGSVAWFTMDTTTPIDR
jgi:hypothetical protein